MRVYRVLAPLQVRQGGPADPGASGQGVKGHPAVEPPRPHPRPEAGGDGAVGSLVCMLRLRYHNLNISSIIESTHGTGRALRVGQG